MKVISVLCLVIVAVAAVPNRFAVPLKDAVGFTPRIISGQPAQAGQFPWQGSNRFRLFLGWSFCGCALINPLWVFTAAHCAENAQNFIITFGTLFSNNADEPNQDQIQSFETKQGFVHENYNSFILINDVALVKLPSDVVFNVNVQPIPLGSDSIGVGQRLTVSGWGIVADGNKEVSKTLNFVELTTISNKDCQSVYGAATIIHSTLCCKGAPEHSTCSGDSGGPLVIIDENGTAKHAGVVSFVHKAGCASGNPSGYARTEKFIDWVDQTVNAN